ncbi:uncharacterized protein LOC115687214, partial [Syzygium oleosum]|uniref:uncharacterized protein LOC115687214 n=1 Tax=Syzygium oleosum TaxID=219896 RepID=UPI0024BA7F8C
SIGFEWLFLAEPAKYTRALPPAHYSLKIESFSALSRLDKGKYDSEVFKAGGYKWSLSLYPNGNKKQNGSGYISLYLSIKEKDKLDKGLKVHVNYKLFVHNKSRKEYLTVQDADGAVSSFQSSKTRCGFPRLLSLKKFKQDGYLDRNDSCTFGAEVFVIQPAEMTVESFTLTRYPPQNTFTWKFQGWSTLGTRRHSDEFTIEGRQWKLLVDQKGNASSQEKSLSVYLEVQRLTPKMKVYAEFSLRVLNQVNEKKKKEKTIECWLCASDPKRGDADFMPLKDLQKPAKGCRRKDSHFSIQ